ncbi:MAG: hypothetical protein GEV13_09405 [Rhodospirillales bacterium]|nr:hypothetical protein [Rhodospirillales bacterium]
MSTDRGGGLPVATTDREIVEIEQAMHADINAYHRDSGMQARYLELLTAREAGQAPAPVAAVGREVAEIERLMADHRSEYWKGPRAAALQQRYRELIGGRPEPIAGLDGMTPDPSAPKAAVDAASRIMLDLSAGERAGLIEAWDWALPVAAQQAAIRELAAGAPSAPPVSQADVDEVAATDFASSAIVAEWGTAAPRRLGVLRARLRRIMSGLSPADQQQTRHWLDTARPAEFRAIARHLAGT